MILQLYRGATSLAAPGLRRMLARRARLGKEITTRLAEREGQASLPRPPGRLVWIHAASVGETISVLPVIELLVARGPVLLTTGTVTSARLAEQRLPTGAIHQFVPLDVPAWIARFLDYWRPFRAVFLESEIWPNLLSTCDARRIPRFLVNGRISAKSARNWRRMPGLARRLLGGFVSVHAQSKADAAQFRALGAAPVLDWGNLKFSNKPLPYSPADFSAMQTVLPGPVWLAASTHAGEEEIINATHQALLPEFPSLITIMVPRHPERGAHIAGLCNAAPRRSLRQPPRPGQIYIADTLGELGLFFRLAPFAFIGNSLFDGGGHNIIEPAKLAKPVICGPSMENFAEAFECLEQAQAVTTVHNRHELIVAVRTWLTDPKAVMEAGLRAAAVFSKTEFLPHQLVDLILEGDL